jgi:hypothetical protein
MRAECTVHQTRTSPRRYGEIKSTRPRGAAALYVHVYTKCWHTFKRPTQKICTFFAVGANWPRYPTYAAGAVQIAASEFPAAGQPTLNFMLLDPVHIATIVMFFVICAMAGEIALAGRRPKQ